VIITLFDRKIITMKKPYINKIHIILELLGYIMMLLSLIYAIVMVNTMEGEIPTHYNVYGEVDGYGPPSTLLYLPIIMIATCLMVSAGLHCLSADKWNTGFKLNSGRENIVLADFGYMMASLVTQMGLFTLVTTYFFDKNGSIIMVAAFVLIAACFITIAAFLIKAYIDNKVQ